VRLDDVRYGPWRVPRSSACDLEEARLYGDDLPGLDAIAIEAELQAIVGALAMLPPAARPLERGWLLERRERLLTARGPTPCSTPASRRSPRTLRIEVG
jgi:hypothetical protein